MLRLDQTTRKLQIVLAGAITTNQIPVMVSYSDKTSTTYNGATQVANSNSTTAVDICAAPAASTIRDVDYVSVRNSDTAAATATIRYNDNATLYTLITATLAVGDQLVYTHGNGWQVLDTSGQIKTASTGGVSLTASNITNVAAGGIVATDVQAALNELDTEKAPKASPTFTGTVTVPTPFTIGAVSMTATGTELNHVAGVTSAIQTQLDAKAQIASPTFTGVVAIQAGAAATPSFIPTGDTNTGMWFPAADTIAWSTGGTERMRISSTGVSAPVVSVQHTTTGNQLRVNSSDGTAALRTYSTANGDGLIINHYYAVAGAPYLRTADFVSSMGDISSSQMRFFTKAASANPALALTISSNGYATFASRWSCNNATPQASAASGGALAAYAAGANGLSSGAEMSAMHALVVAMRAALVANGIMS